LSATIDEFGVGTFNLCVDSHELELHGLAVVCDDSDHPGIRKFASSGVPAPGTHVSIVNTESREILPDRQVGEIYLSSPCVANGYLHDADLTAAVFGVKPAGASDSAKFLATGDKGFMHDGHLYVVGRLKDLLIVNGRNIAPQDIEFFIQEHFHQLRPGCQIAVQVISSSPSATTEAFVFISEVRDTEIDSFRSNERKAAELTLAIRSAILRQFHVEAHSIALVEPRTIPKTTSGKVRRNDAGKLWRADGLRKVYQAVFDSPASKPSTSRPGRRSILTHGIAESPVSPRLRRAAILVQPNSTTEEVVLELVCDVFGFTEAISVTEDLFDVGLDSIRLTQLISRMEGRFSGVSWSDALTMETLSVKTIAEFIDAASGDAARGKRGRVPIALPESDKRSKAGSLLSFGQERLLMVHRKLGSSCSYNVPVALKIRSTRDKIDERFLVECMNKIIRRHKILTTPYPKAQSENKFGSAAPSVVIMSPTSRDPTDAMQEIIESLNTSARTPFNLETGPLVRVIVYLLSSTEVVLFVNVHHIATDGWSMGVILRDLSALIAGEPLKPLDLQFDDYAFFERANLATKEVWNQKLGFWKNEVADLQVLNWLPRNYLGARDRSEEGRVFTFTLDAHLMARLSALAQSARTTLYVVLLAAFQLVMHRYSQQDDIFVVSPFANRRYRNVEDLVGYFINTLILRTSFADAADLPFKQLLQRVKENVGRVSAHQDFPVELAAPASKGGDHPLFRTLFSLRNFPFSLDVPGYSVEQMFDVNTSAAMYEFALELQPATDGSFVGLVQYSPDLFSAATIEEWYNHFSATLASVCENPNQEVARVNIFSPQEKRQLLSFSSVSNEDAELKPTSSDEKLSERGIVEPERYTIHELFSIRAKRIPQQLAGVSRNEKITYGELDALTSALADHFVHTGFIAPGENPVVAVVLPRGIMLLQAYLALMKAGAAYMPILVSHSDQWVSDLLHQSGSMQVVCSEEHLPRFKTIASQVSAKITVIALDEVIRTVSTTPAPSFQPVADPNHLVRPRFILIFVFVFLSIIFSQIYVIYTSGSTGTPKGVLVPQKGVATTMFYQGRRLGVGPADRQLQFFSPQFDGAASEMWLPLIHGATVVFPPEETVKVGRELIDYMNDQEITFIMVLPNVLRLLRLNPVRSLRIIQVCGEACPADIVSEFREQNWDVRIFNAYGPTEASICNAIGELRSPVVSNEPLETAPIGRPLPSTTACTSFVSFHYNLLYVDHFHTSQISWTDTCKCSLLA
jgi:non-ribosomal peptide synthetase component F/aryl carrier-like protein